MTLQQLAADGYLKLVLCCDKRQGQKRGRSIYVFIAAHRLSILCRKLETGNEKTMIVAINIRKFIHYWDFSRPEGEGLLRLVVFTINHFSPLP
jgi:hypothetical protein